MALTEASVVQVGLGWGHVERTWLSSHLFTCLPAHAHHLMVVAIRQNVLPASRLPKVVEAWEEPKHAESRPRTAWSLFNAFTAVQNSANQRLQMDGSLRLSSLFRRELQLS